MAEIDKSLPNVADQLTPGELEVEQIAQAVEETPAGPTELTENEDGSVDINFDPTKNLSASTEFSANIAEVIEEQVLNRLGTDKIWFKAQTGLTETGDLNIKMDSTSYYPNEKIKSMILDIFDFNYTKFKNENLTDFDYVTQIETQLEKSNWVNLKDFSELNLF
jgi:hypothetical protein